MCDTELSDLVKKFQAIQRQEVPNQIGERNVVEIINVLREKKMVDLLYTLDGKEYLTWDQLRREVVDEIVVNGGRMNVVDLPGCLNVHVTYIERVLPEVLEDPSLRIESGEFMTDEYLDSTIQAAAEALNEQGFLDIAEFAKSHRFSSIFAHDLLMRAVESRRLRAVAEGNAIYTKQFVHSQRVILRAGLMAATRPVNLAAFFARHNLFLPLMDPVVDAVRDELPGKVEGRVYVPTCFEVARAEQVENVYFSNGFIDYALLHQHGIPQAKEFLLGKYNPALGGNAAAATGAEPRKRRGRRNQNTAAPVELAPVARTERHPNAGHALSSCFVSDRFLANLIALEDLTQGDTLALDLALHLPSAVDFAQDSNTLLGRLRELHPIINFCVVLDGGVLVHGSALDKVKARLRAVFEERLKQGGDKRPRKASERTVFGDEQEQTFLRVLAEVTGLSLQEYSQALEDLSSQWKDAARGIYDELVAAVEQNAAVDLKRMRSRLQLSLGSAWVELFVASKGVAWCSSQLDEVAATAINRHVLNTRALPMVRDVLLNESLDAAEMFARVSEVLTPEQPTVAVFQKALRAFPEKRRPALLPMVEAVNGKSVGSFVSLLQEMCTTGQIAISSFHQPNKKVERETLAAVKKELRERVENGTFGAGAAHDGVLFALICSLLLHSQFRVHVELPGRAVGSVVSLLVKEVAALSGVLRDAHELIMGAFGGKELSAESLVRLEELRMLSLEEV
ncbi:CG1104 protein-like protein [Trypanosoma conorhini]|uniref:CG1104 protein-like protein n=1 Tax=Trypanosoma conorhini TaxID=83891 RepID=A0A422Q766_9TRYP|nr:CG1104 protein-like protein [Trypanosoma conorhini]RNF25777.1 CG1104 protein-like protein [Trypanosoma conorhini]